MFLVYISPKSMIHAEFLYLNYLLFPLSKEFIKYRLILIENL
jgi:hypothetical protein